MDSLYFIVNPVAGNGRSRSRFMEVEKLLKEKGVPYQVVETTRPLEAASLAKEALERGENYIIAVGGDGTVNEVAGVLCNTQAHMGVLPFGTGNDLARTLLIPTDPARALDCLLGRKVRKMDAGLANERFFVNVAGMGFDVAVLCATDKYKRFGGMIPYLFALFEVLSKLRTLRLEIKTDEGGEFSALSGDYVVLCIGNGACFAGGMKALPAASPFDGSFDVCAIDKLTVPRLLRLLPKFIAGKHTHLPVVRYFRAKEIRVQCANDDRIQLDGEIFTEMPVTFRLLPGALNMVTTGE